jgi:expansin (peptidoglycan-binding protein)
MTDASITADLTDITCANTIDDVHEIVATVIYMGVKGGGIIKRESQSETGARRCNKAEREIMIGAYLKDIDSGEMIQETIARADMSVAVR